MNLRTLLQYKPLLLLLSLYFILSLVTLMYWHIQDKNTVTGDEPHYLIMAKSIFQHGQLEQTLAYQEEFQQRAIYPGELAAADAIPTPDNTHGVNGPRGMYNVHNLGLPLLLGIPLLLGGVMGAKIFLVMLNAVVVMLAWQFAGLLTTDPKIRFAATLLVSLAAPLLPAAGQVFPDLLAGSIALGGLYWLFAHQQGKTLPLTGGWMLSVAYLPWLQIKFIPIMLILGGTMMYTTYRQTQRYRQSLYFSLLMLASLLALFAYYYYAFGKLSGPYPYQGASLEFSANALVVLTGLFIDQNHGFLLQHPVMWVGVFALGLLFKQYRLLAWVWTLVFLGLIVPNGLHNAWYGGYSFMGRFQWSATIVFIIPTLLGLVQLGKQKPSLFWLVMVGSLLLQGYFYWGYTSGFIQLYNRGPAFILDYPEFYAPVYQWLPILFKPAWAYQHPTNLSWIWILLVVFTAGCLSAFKPAHDTRKVNRIFIASAFFALMIGGFSTPFVEKAALQFNLSKFNSKTGHFEKNTWVAQANKDQPSHLIFGPPPRIGLPEGQYQLNITYQLNLPNTIQGGNWDIYNIDRQQVIKTGALLGTAGTSVTTNDLFKVSSATRDKYEFRIYWDGTANIQVNAMSIQLYQPKHITQ